MTQRAKFFIHKEIRNRVTIIKGFIVFKHTRTHLHGKLSQARQNKF